MAISDFYSRQGVIEAGPGGFSVHASRSAKYKRNGPRDYAKSIRKFKVGGTRHTSFFFDHHTASVKFVGQQPDVAAGAKLPGNIRAVETDVNQEHDDGMAVVQAEDIENDTEYACPVTIGNPGVTLTLDFDTGSSDFWVWSSEFRASQTQLQDHHIYNPENSHTSEKLPGEAWEVKYGDGSTASGDVHLDTVVIGNIMIQKQAVEVAEKLSDAFLKGGSDGLLGLAFPKLNTVKPHRQKTPMQNMIEQGLVKEPIFTVKLDKHDSRGFYTFGYIDETVHSSKLYWQPIIEDSNWWEAHSAYVKIGSDILDRGHHHTAIIDTGTTLILLDDASVEHLYSKIPGARLDHNQGGYVFPTDAHIPSLAFGIGHWLFTVPSSELLFSDAGNGMSYGAVQSRGQNPQDILGDVFLKHVYVVFDQGENPRVGIAQRS